MPALSGKKLALAVAGLAEEKKGENVQILDLRKFGAPAEYFVIATGNSEPHIRALSDHIEDNLRKKGTRAFRVDGGKGADWRIIDFFDVMVHLFSRRKRAYYDIEELYSDAPKVSPVSPDKTSPVKPDKASPVKPDKASPVKPPKKARKRT